MRPIKFRAWDIHKSKFIPTDVWMIRPERKGKELAVMVKDWEDYGAGECFYSENQTVEQFTGLLDSKGVEIYESDIVRSHAHNPSLYQVIYDQGCYFASSRSCKIELWHFEDSTGCCLEVIGNVHQHPEIAHARVELEPTIINSMKADCIEEFFVQIQTECESCDGDGCLDCGHVGHFTRYEPIPWTTCKDIFKRMYKAMLTESKERTNNDELCGECEMPIGTKTGGYCVTCGRTHNE